MAEQFYDMKTLKVRTVDKIEIMEWFIKYICGCRECRRVDTGGLITEQRCPEHKIS